MRYPYLIAIPLLLAGCSDAEQGNPNGTAAAMGTPADAAAAARGDEPATSASAQDARKTVERYFALIDQRKFREARQLWGNGGADMRGSAAKFAASFDRFSRYEPEVGEPSEIKARDGMQYVLVDAKVTVQTKKESRIVQQSGSVMLKRSADPAESAPDKKDWRIWGVDLRERH